jgi:hypothetical protein
MSSARTASTFQAERFREGNRVALPPKAAELALR